MTEQPTTPPEPIQQSAFPTGRGVRWSAHLSIDGPVPPAQPYQPPPRTRPAGWAKTGTLGASATLGHGDEPSTVPARPYGGWDRPLVSEEEYVPCRFDDETCVGQITADRLCDVHRFRSPVENLNPDATGSGPGEATPSLGAAGSSLGAAMHTCADHCQCDETRCSSCADGGLVCETHPDRPWGDLSDDINACHCGAGMPCPDCCDPIPEDGSTTIGAAFIPRKFRSPPAVELRAMADDLNTHGGYDERFVAGLLHAAVNDMPSPSPSTMKPVTYDTIMEAMGKFGPLPLAPPDPIKLTREQADSLPKATPRMPGQPDPTFFGTPVEIVETVEESTPYQLANAKPGGIVEIHGELSDAEFETLRADWVRAVDAKPRLSRWIVEPRSRVLPFGEPFRPLADTLDTAQHPPEHQHIWTTTSPMRCAECRRYLTPWWRRILDRIGGAR